MIYLASPHAGSESIREARALAARAITAHYAKQGVPIYSPINHNHWLGICLDHEEWMALDIQILRHCSEMWVACLPGWKKSVGIQIELEFCKEAGIPVSYRTAPFLQKICGKSLWRELSTLTV